jgi:hypothetical protein
MNGPEIYGTIFTVAPSFHDTRVIWTGSDDGVAHVTRDGGKAWTDVTPAGLPRRARISLVEASHHAPGTAYLAAKAYLQDDRAPYLYRTHDWGKTWTKIVGGIRADDYVHAVREDPARAGLLYAGTEHGVYVSWDDGAHWRSLSLNLPDVQVSDIAVEKNDVVIATHGRSLYVLDDVAPLREAGRGSAGATAAGATLQIFTPRVVTRGVDQATIQYALPRPADSVRVEILDATGKVIRSFVGGGSPKPGSARADSATGASGAKPDSARTAVAVRDTILSPTGCETPRRRREAAKPTGRAGLNRFTWDLRHEGATTFDCMIVWSAAPDLGPLAVPGRYAVRVTALGTTATRPLTVRMDPRLRGVTPVDLDEQLALATRIRDRVSAANGAVLRIRTLRSGIADRVARAGSGATDVARSGEALSRKLGAIEEELYQVRNRSGQDPLNFPIRLNNRLAALGRSVGTGDARPTAAAYVVYRELAAELARQLEALGRVETTEVAAFDRVAAGRGLAPVGAGGR